MNLLEIHFHFISSELSDLLVAELSELDYTSFWEREDGLCAYIESDRFEETQLKAILQKYFPVALPTYEIQHTQGASWDKAQADDFAPILISEKCLIHSPQFQPSQTYLYEIIIQPKLSFGTGQHPSTYASIECQLELNFAHKNILDLGCGSGILAILAAKMAAKTIDAIDNNPWAVTICKENIALNHCFQIKVQTGDIYQSQLSQSYDFILANLNAQVLLKELPDYIPYLSKQGSILLSGFMSKDEKAIHNLASQLGLSQIRRQERKNWLAKIYRLVEK